jgi:glycosyltransferase involved in cell wall biosynthesis
VDIPTYLQKIDFTLLTSISEGQPFAILESLAASRPLVATDVGSCRELIESEGGDPFGPAGIYVPPMSQTDLLNALIEMCRNEKMRKEMGKAGQARMKKYYGHEDMVNKYLKVYEKVIKIWQE